MIASNHFHPMVVHFPIALVIAGFCIDAFTLFFCKKAKGLSKAGFILLIMGTIGAVAGYFTGEYFTREMIDGSAEDQLKELHEFWAKTAMYILIGVSVLRIYARWSAHEKGALKWFIFIAMMAATAAIAYSGFLGGSLVHDYMIPAL